MELLAAICDHVSNGIEEEAVTLRGMVSGMKIYEDKEGMTRPYIIVEEAGSVKEVEPLEKGSRVDNDSVLFSVYGEKRSQVVEILDAIENCFLRKLLTTTDKTTLSKPTRDPRPSILRLVDHYQGQTQLSYLRVKDPQ